MGRCEHRTSHMAEVDVTYLEDSGRFMLHLKVRCADCGEPFRFLGLPVGLDLNGATRSPDGTEARLGLHPSEDAVPDGDILTGFSIRKRKFPDA